MTNTIVIAIAAAKLVIACTAYWAGSRKGFAKGFDQGKDIGYKRGQHDSQLASAAAQGIQVQGRLKKGKDNRFGLQVGPRPTPSRPFAPDFITTLSDRKRDVTLVQSLFRRYWPKGRLVDHQGNEVQ